jgi:hypothetical protein
MKTFWIVVIWWLCSSTSLAETSRVACYRINCISNDATVDYIDCFVWFKNGAEDDQVVANILIAGKDGDFNIYAEYVRLEVKRDDETWHRVTEFENKRLRQEILSKTISVHEKDVVLPRLLEVGYPHVGHIPTRIRLNFGNIVRK